MPYNNFYKNRLVLVNFLCYHLARLIIRWKHSFIHTHTRTNLQFDTGLHILFFTEEVNICLLFH